MKPGDLESLHKEEPKDSWNEKKKKAIAIKTSIQESINDEVHSDKYATFAYIPCVGPIVAFSFKKSQRFVKLHAQNAFYLQAAFFAIWLCVWLIENLPIISSFLKVLQFVPFVTNALMYLNVIVFLVISSIGAWNAHQKKVWMTPFLYKFINEKIFKGLNRSKKGNNAEDDASNS